MAHSSFAERAIPRTVSPSAFRRITLGVLVTQVLIVMSGAAVRLTGSGLGCSDWPNCEQDRFVPAADYNALIEFANRVVSLPVVIAVVLAIWASTRREPFRPLLARLSWTILAGVIVQILLGAVVVRLELIPSTVIPHFLLSMVLIALSVALHHEAAADLPDPDRAQPRWEGGASRRMVLPLGILGAAVLVAGTIVTAAGPHGGDEDAERLPLFLPSAVRAHAVLAWVFLALLVAVLVSLRRERAPRSLLSAGSLVLVSCVAQGLVGYVQYAQGVPAGLVFLHVVGSMAVWGTTVHLILEHRRLTAAPPVPSHAGATS